MILQAITWDVKPFILEVGNFRVAWYGLLFAGSLFLGYLMMKRFFNHEKIDLKKLDSLTMYVIVGTILGARLGHVLFYQPEYYFANPIDILKTWEGGLASHGGALGIIIAIWLYGRKWKSNMLHTLDRLVIPTALAGFFIRMGNLINSEIYGDYTNLPWGFIFIRDGQTLPAHPTQIYEALCYLAIFFFLWRVYKKRDGKIPHGYTFGLFMVLVFTARFIIEFVKQPQVTKEMEMAINIGQLLSLPFILVGIYFFQRARKRPDAIAESK